MVYHNASLLREINHLEGPNGEVVVVVRPDQDLLRNTKLPKTNRCAGFCSVAFLIVGFILTCAGFLTLEQDRSSIVYKVGLVFLFIGSVMGVFFFLSFRIKGRDRRKRARLYARNARSTVQAAEEPLISTRVAQDSPASLQAYRLSMLLRGSEYHDQQHQIGSRERIHPTGQIFNQSTQSSSAPSLHIQRDILAVNHEAPNLYRDPNISEPRAPRHTPYTFNQRQGFTQESNYSSAPSLHAQNIASVRNG